MSVTRIAIVLTAFAAAGAGTGLYLLKARPQTQAQTSIRAIPFARDVAPTPLPELRFRNAAGRELSLADFRGRIVLLNLWATWCTPCREEMPTLDRLQAELGGPEFEVVALSVDQQGEAPVRRFFEEIGVKALERYVDPSAQAAFRLNAIGLPATLLVDRSGREVGRHVGPAIWDSPEIVADLRRRIAKDPAP